MNIWQTLEHGADRDPEAVALVDSGRHFSYAELRDRVGRLASFLRSQGIGHGDRISILEWNSHRYLETYYAAAGLGAILNPLNIRLHPREMSFIIRDAGSQWLIANSAFAGLVELLPAGESPLQGVLWIGEPARPDNRCDNEEYERAIAGADPEFAPASMSGDDIAHLYYTSGTTGEPKGVPLTHKNVCVHARSAIAEFDLGNADVWGHFAPMFHLVDAWATFAITWAGGRHVFLPSFDPGQALELIQSHGVTVTNLVPTMLNAMVHHPEAERFGDHNLRLILSGGSPIAPALVETVIARFGCEYAQTYGMTETSPYLTVSLLHEHLRRLPPAEQIRYRAKTGRPFQPVELKVVGDDGQPVVADEKQVGEIWVRGDTVTPGYWNREQETRESFTDDGWLKTGDLAVVDGEGYVTIVDRAKDMIITAGENVYSGEVENTLFAHPLVREAAVFGVPDESWGEAVVAAVVLVDGGTVTEQELTAYCREHLTGFKVPKIIRFMNELPKTGSGKIRKRGLRGSFRAT